MAFLQLLLLNYYQSLSVPQQIYLFSFLTFIPSNIAKTSHTHFDACLSSQIRFLTFSSCFLGKMTRSRCNQCYVNIELQNIIMLKVIFKVQRLQLKLNNIKCEIVAKKDLHIIQLTPLLTISNGQATIGAETEFLIVQNDPLFLLQVTLVCQGAKKLGGELSLNIADWDENVHHSTVAGLQKSPDRHSQISYTFLYIRKNYLAPQKSLILCSEYRDKNITEMETKTRELTKKRNRLEDEIKRLEQENLMMQSSEQIRKQEITTKKRQMDQKMKSFQQTIEQSNFKNNNLKKKNEEMMKMIQIYAKEQTKKQLVKKYPKNIEIQVKGENAENNEDMMEIDDREKETKTRNRGLTKSGSSRESSEKNVRSQRERSREKAIINFKIFDH